MIFQNNLISIVLPTHNGVKYLRESIDSIISQSYMNWELIAVDDASNDNTSEILEEYANKDKRIRIVTNACNLGLPESLNVGFRIANGKYLTWTSDDNKYRKNALEDMKQALDEYDGASLVHADMIIIDENGNNHEVIHTAGLKELPYRNMVGACFLYKKNVAERAGEYDVQMTLAEDYEYWIRLSMYGKLIHLPKDLYYYRTHGESLTSQRFSEINSAIGKVKWKHFYYLFSVLKSNQEKGQFVNGVLFSSPEDRRKERKKIIIRYWPGYRLYLLKSHLCSILRFEMSSLT